MTIPRLQKRMNVPSQTSSRRWTATDGRAKVGSRRRGRGGTRALLWHQRPPTKEGTGPSPTEAGRTVVSTDGVAGGFGAVDPAAGAALGAAGPRVARQCRAPNVNRRTGRDQSLAGRAPAEGSRLGSCFAAKGKNRLLPALLLALTLWLAAADPADAHLGHEVGARFAVAQQLGPLALALTVETPPRTPGPLFVDLAVEGASAVPATLALWLVPRDAPVDAAAAGVRVTLLAGDPGPYPVSLPLPAPGSWELALQAEGAAETARIPIVVEASLPRSLSATATTASLAGAGALLALGFAAVGGAGRRGGRLPAARLAWLGLGVVACLAVAATLAVQQVFSPPAPEAAAGRPYLTAILRTDPAQPRAGQPLRLSLALVDGATGRPADDLAVHHEALVHAFLVGEDGSSLAHLHPARLGPGRFVATATPPRPGPYTFSAEVSRQGSGSQLLAVPVAVAPAAGGGGVSAPTTHGGQVETLAGRHDVGDLVVEAAASPAPVAAGAATTLTFRLTRAGSPAADLQPWLGMPGHLVVRGDDGSVFAHVHGSARDPSGPPADPLSPQIGPDLSFTYTFPRPGSYRLWLQFKRADEVQTVPMRIDVAEERTR